MERINSVVEAHYWGLAAVFLLLFLACSIAEDLRLKMWNDEIVTLYVAQQGSPAEIVKATRSGMDATPPLYPIIVSAILPIVRPDALAVRLPSTLGFTAMLAFILAFCRRARMPAMYAFIGALLAALACEFYATEGRSYGMVLGSAAGVLSCWQGATESKPRVGWLALLTFFLMLATSLNYYSIFLLVPLGVAELVRWRALRKPDLPVLAAMLPALAVLALHYPLISAGRKYLAHFWAPGIASWRQIPDFYLQFALIPAGVILIALVVLAMTSGSPDEQALPNPTMPQYEVVAVVTLAFTPILVIVISRYTTHVFLARYALWAVIGISIGSASLLWRSSRKRPAVGVVVLALLVAVFAARQVRSLRQRPELRQGESTLRELQSVPDGPEPIVVSYDHAFMELSYYAEPRLRSRLVYPLSRSMDLKYKGSDLDYLLLSAMGRRTNLSIVELDAFLKTTSRFVLAANQDDYLPQYLAAAGYRIVPTNSGSKVALYEVTAQGPRVTTTE